MSVATGVNPMIPLMILAESGVGTIVVRSLVIVALVIAAFFGVVRLRAWLQSDDEPAATGPAFSLSDLKQLHRDGQLTDEEFERMRSKMVGAAKAMAARMPDPLAGSRRRAAGGPPGAGPAMPPPPGAVPPRAVPPGAMPPGAVPPRAMPPGVIPPPPMPPPRPPRPPGGRAGGPEQPPPRAPQ